MKLSEKIWRLRENQHMSQEELAEKLGVTRQTVSNWENDKAIPDAEKLAKICKVFGVSADAMLNGEELPQSNVQTQNNFTSQKRKVNNRLCGLIFGIVALLLLVVAAVGLIFSEDKAPITSLITFHSSFIWIALLFLGAAILIGAIVTFFKKK